QATVREGLVLMLGLLPDIEVVGSAANGEEAIALVSEQAPDAVLMDLHMPVLDGVEATRRIARDHPGVVIVVLTTYADDASVLAALAAGARSYLTKDADRSEIAFALRTAACGLVVLDRAVQEALVAAATRGGAQGDQPHAAPDKLPDGLTKREAEILAMIAAGMVNADIAGTLYLSNATVKSHINRIFSKTGSPDRSAAARYAREHHLA
ncbi:MAG TPA: response regulator transcription factor, partial [Acidimicrobiales bacterium]|nr:response regulator transcription factor [Acidimicrobiales bacterium]